MASYTHVHGSPKLDLMDEQKWKHKVWGTEQCGEIGEDKEEEEEEELNGEYDQHTFNGILKK